MTPALPLRHPVTHPCDCLAVVGRDERSVLENAHREAREGEIGYQRRRAAGRSPRGWCAGGVLAVTLVHVETTAKVLLGSALVLALLGVGALVLARLGVDRLPGTIHWNPSENVRVIVPVGLMVIVSIVGTIVLNLWFRR